MTRQRILITGASGLLGSNLAWQWRRNFDVIGLHRDHSVGMPGVETISCDLRNQALFADVCRRLRPDVVVHCAALTDLNRCEIDPTAAMENNVVVTRHVVEGLPLRTRLIAVSTDSVFDGTQGHYRETDQPQPVNVYASTKRQAETEALQAANVCVVRTNMYGWSLGIKQTLAEWFVDQLERGESPPGFTDVFFSPLYVEQLADLLGRLLVCTCQGILHLGSSDRVSKHEFGVLLAQAFGFPVDRIRPVQGGSLMQPRRPADTSLDTRLAAEVLGRSLPSVAAGVQAFHAFDAEGGRTALGACRLACPAVSH